MERYIKTVILKVIKMKINSGIIKIVHNFGYKITDIYEEKLRVVKSEIEQLKQEGYDGHRSRPVLPLYISQTFALMPAASNIPYSSST